MSFAFRVKTIISLLFDVFGISSRSLENLNKKYNCQYVRIINYHHVKDLGRFERQLEYYCKHFNNINYNQFEGFFNRGILPGNKPGIILTFDDGYDDNYKSAEVLEKYEMTGWFMVSSNLVGTDGYMGFVELRELIKRGHVIGCHTANHHRMERDDDLQILEQEIKFSKQLLESKLYIPVDIFCWCGGEERHYTPSAAKEIRNSGYKYGFMTCSYPVFKNTDKFHIHRINVEDSWPISLVKLQICGFMDKHFREKRKRVEEKTI